MCCWNSSLKKQKLSRKLSGIRPRRGHVPTRARKELSVSGYPGSRRVRRVYGERSPAKACEGAQGVVNQSYVRRVFV
ncbi:hypothetical protein Efla_000528 [Eimeria flavescens]